MEFCLETCTTCKYKMKQIYELTNGDVQYEKKCQQTIKQL